MKRTRLNHAKVNALLSDREIDFNLPGGIKQTPARIRYDGEPGLSDFNKFYVTNAVKAYLGMHNDFDSEGTMSRQKLNEVVMDTLKHYDLLIEEDLYYGLFRLSQEIKRDILTLDDGDILENQDWDEALNFAKDAASSLQSIKDNRKDNGEPISTVVEGIRKELLIIGKNNRMTLEELLEEIKQ